MLANLRFPKNTLHTTLKSLSINYEKKNPNCFKFIREDCETLIPCEKLNQMKLWLKTQFNP